MNRFASRLEKVTDIADVTVMEESQKEKSVVTKTKRKERARPTDTSHSRIPVMPKVERKEVRSYSLLPSTIKKLEEVAIELGYRSSSLLVQTILDAYLTEEKG